LNETKYAIMDSSGRFWLGQKGEIKVFGPSGAFLRTIGRLGSGPEEFQRPRPVHTDRRGWIHVIDIGNSRETIYGGDFALQSQNRLPSEDSFSLAPVDDGAGYVMNMWLQTPEGVGNTLHVVRGPDVLHSFGSRPEGEPMNMFTARRLVSVDSGGRVFESKQYAREVEVWHRTGQRIARFFGSVLNERPVQPKPMNFSDNPLPNEVLAIRADLNGHLWIISRHARENWRSFLAETVYPDGSLGMNPKAGRAVTIDSLFTTRLEVVDLQTHRIVAALDRPEMFAGFIGDDLLLQNFVDADGSPRVAVWRVRFDRQ
jgi:hypothetical protein